MRVWMKKTGYDVKIISQHDGVYYDQLKPIFEQETGLKTSLNPNPQERLTIDRMNELSDKGEHLLKVKSTRTDQIIYIDPTMWATDFRGGKIWGTEDPNGDTGWYFDIDELEMIEEPNFTSYDEDKYIDNFLTNNPIRPSEATKEFWNKLYPKVYKRYRRKFGDKKAKEISKKVVGSIWHHKMKPSTKMDYVTRETKDNPGDFYGNFDCPDCGSLVEYDGSYDPPSRDDPGTMDFEITERKCPETCDMSVQDLEEVALDIEEQKGTFYPVEKGYEPEDFMDR